MDKYLFDIDNYIAWYRDVLTVSLEVDKRGCTAFYLQTMLQMSNYVKKTYKDEKRSKKVYDKMLLKFNTLNERIGYYYSPNEWLILDANWWNSLESSFKRNKYNFDLDNKLMLAKNKTDARKTIINLHVEKLEDKKLTFLKSYKETKAIPLLNYHSKYREEFKGLDLGYIQEKTFYSFINDIWIIKGLDYANQLLDDLEKDTVLEIAEKSKLQGKRFEWKENKTLTTELIKSLIEAGSIKGLNEKEIFKEFGDFLGLDLTAKDTHLQDIKKKNIDSQTAYIDRLQKSFIDFLSK